MKICIGCSQSLELKKFYAAKRRMDGSPVRASRCMPCARKQVMRRYHLTPKKKHERSCNHCEYFTGSDCRKTSELKSWEIKKRVENMKDPKYRDWHKRCFVKMVISQVRSA